MATIRGGSKLEAKLREIAQAVAKPANLRAGFLENASYPDGTSVALVAVVQDFGAPSRGIPPRPFFRNMVAAKSSTWGDAVAKNLKAADYDATVAMTRVGEGIKGQLQASIREFAGVPLKPATIARKGFSAQLIDTGHMLDSVDFEVKG